jgi:hypothetical protein
MARPSLCEQDREGKWRDALAAEPVSHIRRNSHVAALPGEDAPLLTIMWRSRLVGLEPVNHEVQTCHQPQMVHVSQ